MRVKALRYNWLKDVLNLGYLNQINYNLDRNLKSTC